MCLRSYHIRGELPPPPFSLGLLRPEINSNNMHMDMVNRDGHLCSGGDGSSRSFGLWARGDVSELYFKYGGLDDLARYLAACRKAKTIYGAGRCPKRSIIDLANGLTYVSEHGGF